MFIPQTPPLRASAQQWLIPQPKALALVGWTSAISLSQGSSNHSLYLLFQAPNQYSCFTILVGFS